MEAAAESRDLQALAMGSDVFSDLTVNDQFRIRVRKTPGQPASNRMRVITNRIGNLGSIYKVAKGNDLDCYGRELNMLTFATS